MADSSPSERRPQDARRIPLVALGAMRGGYVASKATADHPEANYLRALQASDIAADGSVDWNALRFVAAVSEGGRYGVNDGDVLLPLRSARITAVVPRQVPAGVIAVGHWAIVSPDRELADPDFLAWYLNHPATAVRLAGLMRGTKLQFLSLTDLRGFEIELPPLDVQRRIARVHALNERIAGLEQELAEARKQYIDAVTMEALHGHLEPNPE
jgi:hypothetical protein